MKKFNLLLSALLLISMCVLTGCSKSENDYSAYVSDKTQVLAGINFYDLVVNAGCEVDGKGITLSPALNNALRGNSQGVKRLLSIRGIDPREVIVAVSDVLDGQAMMYARITDTSAFTDYLKNDLACNESKSADGITFYDADGLTIGVEADLAIISMINVDRTISCLEKCRKDAAASPLASWKKDKLDEKKTCTVIFSLDTYLNALGNDANYGPILKECYDVENFENCDIILSSELKDLTFEMKSYIAKDGKKLENKKFEIKDFDKNILRYTKPEDFVALACSFPKDSSWKNLLNEQFQKMQPMIAATIAKVYENLDGSMMMSFGYTSLNALMSSDNFHFVMASQTVKGTIDQTFNDWCEIASNANLPITKTENQAIIDLDDIKLVISKNGDEIVLSTDTAAPTAGNSKLNGEFDKKPGEIVALIPYNDANITGMALPFSLNCKIYFDEGESTFKVVMGDTKGKLLENIINLAPAL